MVAQTEPRMLVVSRDDEELARKVRAEGANAGLAAVELSGAEGHGASNAELLTRHRAVAVVRVVSRDRVEVYVGAAGGREPYSRSLRRRPDDSESFAMRAVEQVRARLIELNILVPEDHGGGNIPTETAAPSASPAEPPAPQDPERSTRLTGEAELDRGGARDVPSAPGPKLWLSGGAAATSPAGGIGATAHGAFGVNVAPSSTWNVSAYALLPATENELSGAEGQAELNASLFLAQFGYSPVDLGSRWLVDFGLGAGLLSLGMRAEATAPFTGQEDRLFAGLYFLHAGAAWSATSWFRMRASALGGLSAPRPVVRFDGHEVAAWGRLFGAAALTAEFGVPLSAQEGSP